MKKFKKVVEVIGDNVQGLFECPIVTEIKKATEAAKEGIDVVDMLLGVTVISDMGTRRQVKRGCFIVQDICGHWEVMDAEQWNVHKDDVIEEEGSASDNDNSTPDDNTDVSIPSDNGEEA